MDKKSNMFAKKLSVALCALFMLVFFNQVKSQGNSNQGIILNEYCASNGAAMAVADSYGKTSDWVELTTTQSPSVSLGGYYLSNDKNNLYKWKFPSNFTIPQNGYRIVWLTGKNLVTPSGEVHASFDLTQCKDQWLILSTSNGVIRDSVFVQKTQLGHSRVRMFNSVLGINGWRIATANTFSLTNPPLAFTYKDYLPKPSFECNAGIFNQFCQGTGEIKIRSYGSLTADSVRDCFVVHYTLNGNFPTVADPVYDSISSNLALFCPTTTVIRAVAYPKATFENVTLTCLPDIYLPSFCETNSYFCDAEYNQIQSEFGVLSIAQHSTEANWVASGGTAPISPTIHIEYFDKNQVTEGYAQMYKPVQESWRTAQKGIYLTMNDNMGFGCDFQSPSGGYPIFNVAGLGASNRTAFPTLHLKAGDFESNSLINSPVPTTTVFGTGIRDVFYQSLAAKNNLHVSPLHIKPVITFINGIYQGVYNLMEVFDQHYEAYYNNQAKDSVDLNVCYNTLDLNPTNGDGSPQPQFSPITAFNTEIYNPFVFQHKPLNNLTFYNQLMSKLDKESFMDYFILGTYATNNDFWSYNVAFARGNQAGKPGTKWHYYMWNMPTIFNFTIAGNSAGTPIAPIFATYASSPCVNMYPLGNSPTITATPYRFNGHGNLMKFLMETNDVTGLASGKFQLEYKNRYQDLLNGPLRCDNILAHFDYVQNLYKQEMHHHEDPSYTPAVSPYSSFTDTWDSNMVQLRRIIAYRCDWMINGLKTCKYYGQGPYPITVDVEPAGAGSVKLNTMVLPYYKWSGNYFPTTMSFKAIPTSSLYAFDHWEFKVHQPLNGAPLSKDSVAISFIQSGTTSEEVIAVFTDKTSDITQNGEFANMPSAFSPNNDNINDIYKPLGSAMFTSEYDFRIYNRWGQEVFRSTDPAMGWDGTFDGQQSITGVYAWVITYKNVFNESKIAKGNVTLVR